MLPIVITSTAINLGTRMSTKGKIIKQISNLQNSNDHYKDYVTK